MIKTKIILLLTLLLGLVSGTIVYVRNKTNPKKKILILTSFGGGGNLAASNALESYLKNNYNVQSCYVFKELFTPLDPLNYLTFKHYSGEEFYNWFIPGKFFRVLGWIYYFGVWYIQLRKKSIHTILRNYLIRTKPDVIISVIPIINNIVLDVAQELNIPFLLIPADLDVNSYIIKIAQPTYKNFYVGLPFDDEEIKKPLKNAHIPEEHIFIIGPPLRTDFFIKKNKNKLRKEHAIDENKSVVMLLMGSHGSDEMKNYVEELLKVTTPLHLIACIGKNEKSRQELEKLLIPPHISLSIVGFTEKISDYMTMSDLFISKSGTLSVCEALYTDLPLLLDTTSTPLPWEKFNHYFIEKYNFGNSIKKYSEVAPLITTITKESNQLETYKNNIRTLKKKNCSKEIKKLIKHILVTQ